MIKQFLTDVYWGELDYLIIDTPPGSQFPHFESPFLYSLLNPTKSDFWFRSDKIFLHALGTSDEHISIVENLQAYDPTGAVVVTTPQVLTSFLKSVSAMYKLSFDETLFEIMTGGNQEF